MKRLRLFTVFPLYVLLSQLTACKTIRGDAPMDMAPFDVETALISAAAGVEVEMEQTLQETEDAVADTGLFDVAVEHTQLRVFLMGLVEGTVYNIVVFPGVEGDVNLDLKQVSVIDVLEILRDMFLFHLEVRGNVIRVMYDTMETQLFSLDYVNLSRAGSSDMRVSAGSISDVKSVTTNNSNNGSSSNDFGASQSFEMVGSRVKTENSANIWLSLRAAIISLTGTGAGRNVTIMSQAGIIVVRALRSELAVVEEFLRLSEDSLHRQVVLEVKILEVVLLDKFERGIDWSKFGDFGGAKNGTYEFGSDAAPVLNSSGLGGVFTASALLTDFEAIIELLESQGTVRVLSSPRIATVNNQKAIIKVGQDEYFVTNVQSTTTTGTSTTTTPSVTLTPFFSGIALDVTPQISRNGDVILHIHPSVSEVTDQIKIVTLGSDVVRLPLALSTIRESDSIVRVKNGQVIVIGGLLKDVSREESAGIPLLSRIPGFSQKRKSRERSELVILIRPIVADPQDQHRDVIDSLRRLKNLGVR